MHAIQRFLLAFAFLWFADGVGFAARAAETDPTAAGMTWPMQLSGAGVNFVVYPPQFEQWSGDRLLGRAAVSVRTQDSDEPRFGMLRLAARTAVDPVNSTVTIGGLALEGADFPAASERAAEYAALLSSGLSGRTWQVPLERLQTDLAIEQSARGAQSQALRHDAPHVIYTQRPAILIPVDGPAVLREVPESTLMRVINTRALILLDPATRRYYLSIAGVWMSARGLEGPWMPDRMISPQLELARDRIARDDQVDLLDDDDRLADLAQPPEIHVSIRPAELLQTDGPPEYVPVADTRLLQVVNSPQRIFIDLDTQQHYALLSGRWYRSPRLDQPGWVHVAPHELPAGFAMIPPDHVAADVRAAVAGTPEAREAVIANTVPEMAGVARDGASLEVNYDGPASFRQIEGTSLQYAVNTATPVIRVDEFRFYALDNGVWFLAGSPYGPWTVASQVPAAIYTIPRSSPLHYVTYVRIYDYTPSVVYVGYTPGYVGSYVASGVVVFGTGWHYRPWIGSVWYGAPMTWGHGFTVSYSWWNPWWHWTPVYWSGVHCFRPWWGPWLVPPAHRRTIVVGAPRGVTTINVVNVTNIYHRWSPKAVAWKSPHFHRPKHAAAPHARWTAGSGQVRFSDGRVHRFTAPARVRPARDAEHRSREQRNLPPIQFSGPRPSAQAQRQAPQAQGLATEAPRMRPETRVPPRDAAQAQRRTPGAWPPEASQNRPRARSELAERMPSPSFDVRPQQRREPPRAAIPAPQTLPAPQRAPSAPSARRDAPARVLPQESAPAPARPLAIEPRRDRVAPTAPPAAVLPDHRAVQRGAQSPRVREPSFAPGGQASQQGGRQRGDGAGFAPGASFGSFRR